tara:strand:- start:552 stop:881 length:330 start_codon:yes stop_codon:yes gene_type:complete
MKKLLLLLIIPLLFSCNKNNKKIKDLEEKIKKLDVENIKLKELHENEKREWVYYLDSLQINIDTYKQYVNNLQEIVSRELIKEVVDTSYILMMGGIEPPSEIFPPGYDP